VLTQNSGDGEQIQDALLKITGRRTVPQVFIYGVFIGGCSGNESPPTLLTTLPQLFLTTAPQAYSHTIVEAMLANPLNL
jgi:hypothetical protein